MIVVCADSAPRVQIQARLRSFEREAIERRDSHDFLTPRFLHFGNGAWCRNANTD